MKTPALLLLIALTGAGPAAAAAPDAAPAASDASPPQFGQISTEYKKPQELPDSFFNPFKIQAVSDAAMGNHEVAAVSNEAVLAAISHRGLSGLIYSGPDGHNRAIIGDEVFSVGDELSFAGDNAEPAPLVAGAAVVLRAVRANNLLLEVTPTGEAARPLVYPLRAFWRP